MIGIAIPPCKMHCAGVAQIQIAALSAAPRSGHCPIRHASPRCLCALCVYIVYIMCTRPPEICSGQRAVRDLGEPLQLYRYIYYIYYILYSGAVAFSRVSVSTIYIYICNISISIIRGYPLPP